jgi:hypothetical protein
VPRAGDGHTPPTQSRSSVRAGDGCPIAYAVAVVLDLNQIGRMFAYLEGGLMTAAPVRFGRLDAFAPGPVPEASGNVVVTGEATLPDRAGPPRPRSSELSLARRTLADHLAAVDSLEAEVERTHVPARRLQFMLNEALGTLAAAEARQTQADAAYAAEVAEAVRAGAEAVPPPPAPDAEIQSVIRQARASCNAYRLALEECRANQAHHTAVLVEAKARGEELLLQVMVEEHHERLSVWADAHEKAVVAEQNLLALHECVGERGRSLEQRQAGCGLAWLRALEKMRTPAAGAVPARELSNRDIMNGVAQWTALLGRLETNPGAALNGE